LITVDFDEKTRGGASPPGAYVSSTGGISVIDQNKLYAVISPNPCSDHATLSLTTSEPGKISIELKDLYGRIVHKSENSFLPAGKHEIVLVGRDAGIILASGTIYLCVIKLNEQTQEVIKFVVIK
jgi:hypothetical protein